MNISDTRKDFPLILVINDDKLMRAELRRAMEQAGYQVVEASDGEQGLAVYTHLHPDIVLIDALMPVMDGFICCNQLQTLPSGDRTPILMIAALEEQELIERAFKAGASDYITKPINWAVLHQRVRRLLQASQVMEELRKTNEQGQQSQKMLQLVMDLIPQSIWWKDRDSRFLGCNRNFAQMTGVGTPEDIIGKTDYDVWTKEDANFFRSIDARVMAQNQAEYNIIESTRHADGTFTWLLTNKIPLHDEEGCVIGTLGTAQDVTKRQQAEEQIKASLQEKEILLKEVHHRVKNNLQIIDSLFRHQCRHTKDEQTTAILKECQNRVNSMALLHEKLYQSSDLSKIDFAGYIRGLTASLFDSYASNTDSPTLKLNIADVFLDIETALPCGLIVNELVSNCLKYAFASGETGTITIDFHCEAEHSFSLIVKDNGVGLPKDFDFRKLQSLGLKLVKSLIRQVNGSLEMNGSNGAEFIIKFTGLRNDVRE